MLNNLSWFSPNELFKKSLSGKSAEFWVFLGPKVFCKLDDIYIEKVFKDPQIDKLLLAIGKYSPLASQILFIKKSVKKVDPIKVHLEKHKLLIHGGHNSSIVYVEYLA